VFYCVSALCFIFIKFPEELSYSRRHCHCQ